MDSATDMKHINLYQCPDDGSSIILSDKTSSMDNTLSYISSSKYYVYGNDGEVYRCQKTVYSKGLSGSQTSDFCFGCKCTVLGGGTQGDELLGLVTGRYEDDYPENGILGDYWYTRITSDGEYDLTGINDALSVIPSFLHSDLYSVEWVGDAESSVESDIIIQSLDPHSASFESKTYATSTSRCTMLVDVPEIKLKCTRPGIYVFSLNEEIAFGSEFKGDQIVLYTRKIKINDVDITYFPTSKGESTSTNDNSLYSYWFNLKKGDILSIKHLASSTTNSYDETVECGDDQIAIHGYKKSGGSTVHYVKYNIDLHFWNYAVVTNDIDRAVSVIPTNKNDYFEVIE